MHISDPYFPATCHLCVFPLPAAKEVGFLQLGPPTEETTRRVHRLCVSRQFLIAAIRAVGSQRGAGAAVCWLQRPEPHP